MSRFSAELFLSRSTEKLRTGTFLSFTKNLISKIFMEKRVGGGRREGVSKFSVNFFCLSSGKTRRGIL